MAARLAYLSGTYPALSETFVTGELRELRRLGEEPLVFAVLRGEGEPRGAPAARYVVELPKREQVRALLALLARRPGRTLRALLRPEGRFGGAPRDVAALAPLARALEDARHLHAHFADLPAAMAGRLSALTGVPWSFTAHAHDVFTEWDRVEEKLAAARFAVVPCEYTRRFVAERAPGQAEKLRVVPCGVDLDEFRRTRPYDPDGPIVAVGRLVEQKGFADLVRAAAARAGELPEVLIAGEGPERPALERLIAESGARVRLLGALTHREVRELWESASLAAVPCVVARDGVRDSVPVALREAMALELPLVATDEVGIPEAAGPRAELVPPRNPEALGAALARVAALPPGERRAMGAAGREHVAEHADLRRETARLLAMFELDRPVPAPVAVPAPAR